LPNQSAILLIKCDFWGFKECEVKEHVRRNSWGVLFNWETINGARFWYFPESLVGIRRVNLILRQPNSITLQQTKGRSAGPYKDGSELSKTCFLSRRKRTNFAAVWGIQPPLYFKGYSTAETYVETPIAPPSGNNFRKLTLIKPFENHAFCNQTNCVHYHREDWPKDAPSS